MIDKLRLQRLVDNELGFDETRQLLQDIENETKDSQAETWRAVAGAFVESQLIRSQFIDRGSLDHESPASEFNAGQGGKIGNDSKLHKTQNSKIQNSKTQNSNGTIPGSVRWLSLAALVLLSITVATVLNNLPSGEPAGATGTMVASTQEPVPGDVIAAQNMTSNQAIDGNDLNQSPAVYRMQVEDPAGKQYLDSDVPLYAGSRSDASKWIRNVDLPQSVYQRAENSGYHIQQDVRYLSGRLRDGRAFVIPVSKYSFSPEQ